MEKSLLMRHLAILSTISIGLMNQCSSQTWELAAGTADLNMQCLLSDAGWDFAGGADGTFRSEDSSFSYAEANVGNTSMGPTRGFCRDADFVFQCTSNGVFRSANSGAQWEQVAEGLPQLLTHGMGATDGRIWVVTQSGVYWSADQGMSWMDGGLAGVNVRCIATIGETVFVGTIDEGLYKSSDYGQTWQPINDGSTSNSYRALEAHDGVLFAGGEIGTGVFRSADQGASWELLNQGIPLGSYRGFATNGVWIAAASFMSGVYVSSDGGDQWFELNDGLTDLSIFDLEFTPTHLIAATNTAGVWRMPLESIPQPTSVSNISSPLPSVYPNPTADWVEWRAASSPGPWQLVDLAGTVKRKGQSQRVDLTEFPTGVYFLQSEAATVRILKID